MIYFILGFGFSSYSNANPFSQAMLAANGLSKGFGSFSSNNANISSNIGNSFPNSLKPSSSDPKLSNSVHYNPKGLIVETTPETINASISTPSPKTEKINPFSSISPKINPFVKMVDSNSGSGIWSDRTGSLSADALTKSKDITDLSSSVALTTSAIVPQTKSFFTSYKDSKASKSDERDEDDDNKNEDEDGEVVEEEAEGPTLTKVYHLPDNVSVVTGEENEECLFQFRAKLYRWNLMTIISDESFAESTPDDQSIKNSALPVESASPSKADGNWIEVGVGPVRILSGKLIDTSIDKEKIENENCHVNDKSVKSSFKKTRVVMRREDKKGGHGKFSYLLIDAPSDYSISNMIIGTKLLLNISIQNYMNISKQGDKAIRIVCVHPEIEGKQPSPQTYLLKTKLPQVSCNLT